MRKNQNLKKIKNYSPEIINAGIKRLHANEWESLVLPEEILCKNILSNLNYYPEQTYQALQSQASIFYNSNFVMPTNGSDEGLDLIIRTFCNANETAVILKPTFSMYKQYSAAFGLNVVEFNLNNNFTIEIENFLTFCKQVRPKIIFIPNPLAPTGGITQQEGIMKIIQTLPQTFIVIDEAYIEFSGEQSAISLVSQHPNLIVTRTLSKFFALAGIRLVFLFTQHINDVAKVRSPYNVK